MYLRCLHHSAPDPLEIDQVSGLGGLSPAPFGTLASHVKSPDIVRSDDVATEDHESKRKEQKSEREGRMKDWGKRAECRKNVMDKHKPTENEDGTYGVDKCCVVTWASSTKADGASQHPKTSPSWCLQLVQPYT
jgi:hypothetical protein